MVSSDRLGQFLREVSNWRWDEFVRAEHDKTFTSNQAMIFALVRACAMQKLSAIKLSLNRLDGKLKTPVRVEYPKIFYLYPKATLVEGVQVINDQGKLIASMSDGAVAIQPFTPPPLKEKDLPSMTLRETLTEMANYPRELPEEIIDLSEQTHIWVAGKGPKPSEVPRVKSVVAAHLLIMAQRRDLDALSEVFDQIDGKLAETIQLLGEDIYITSYASIAPEGAYLNKDGVVEIEATVAQDLWANKLGRGL